MNNAMFISGNNVNKSSMGTGLVVPMVVLSVIMTVLSLLPFQVLNYVYIICWVFSFLLLLPKATSKVKLNGFLRIFFLLLLVYLVYISIATVFTGQDYFTGLFQVVPKAFLMYLLGCMLASQGLSEKQYKIIVGAYILAAFVAAVYIVQFNIGSISSWAESDQYIYVQKNSAGQIIGIAIIFLATCFQSPSKTKTLFVLVLIIGLAVALLLMQCRTAILALAIALLIYIARHVSTKTAIAIVAAALLLLVFQSQIISFVSHALFLDKYANADLDTFSSGRLTLWSSAIEQFFKHPFEGCGFLYVDNMYVSAFASLGVVGAVPLIVIWLKRIVININLKMRRSLDSLFNSREMLMLLTVFYIVESLLEGYPPFGPGSCAFMFWIISGIGDTNFAHVSNEGYK